MKTLFDLKRLADRLDSISKDNPKPFLCCRDCGEYVEIYSKRLAAEIDKLKEACVCQICHSIDLLWAVSAPSVAFQFQLRTKRLNTLALLVEQLKVIQGLQQVAITDLTPKPEEREALSVMDSLLSKPVALSAELIALKK